MGYAFFSGVKLWRIMWNEGWLLALWWHFYDTRERFINDCFFVYLFNLLPSSCFSTIRIIINLGKIANKHNKIFMTKAGDVREMFSFFFFRILFLFILAHGWSESLPGRNCCVMFVRAMAPYECIRDLKTDKRFFHLNLWPGKREKIFNDGRLLMKFMNFRRVLMRFLRGEKNFYPGHRSLQVTKPWKHNCCQHVA